MTKKMKLDYTYDYLLDIYKIINIYNAIKKNCKHRDKLFKFELFYMSYITEILEILKSKNYEHGKYNVFTILEPKCRIIMSENMKDKIINHLVSRYILFPLIEPKLIETNIATRVGKGSKAGIFYMKKYINSLKENYDHFYVLKCDISKFFYSIDHQILLDMLKDVILDKDIYNLIEKIIDSTNSTHLSKTIESLINKRKSEINKLKITSFEKKLKISELDRIPLYNYDKGLPIGNMSSQIFAIFYLNNVDHFIKEKLRVKYYIRYMDDLILLHYDKQYLKYCLEMIETEVKKIKLSINSKTQIIEIHNGVTFLGYKFILKNKKVYMLMNSKVKKRIRKKVKNINKNERKEYIKGHYNGYLVHGNTKGFVYGKFINCVLFYILLNLF